MPENIKKSNVVTYVIIAVAIAVIIGVFLLFGRGSKNTVNISIGNSPVIGQMDAKVTIIEFSDFSCPFCAAASGANSYMTGQMQANNPGWTAPVSGIMKDYVETGKAKLVFKYYPGHGAGQEAHLVSLCLNEQDLFWKFHDLAFANYESTNDLTKMKELAREIGANMTALDSCLNNEQNKYMQELSDEMSQAKTAGLQGTPTFYVNGKAVEGAVPYSDIKKVIDSELG